jgi:hypothetical protein
MKKVLVLALMVFLVSGAFAHGVFLDDDINEKRKPVSYYRWGYTYRVTSDYKNRFSSEDFDDIWRKKKVGSEAKYNYRYVSYLDSYEKTRCYDEPPKGKLFYIKCR